MLIRSFVPALACLLMLGISLPLAAAEPVSNLKSGGSTNVIIRKPQSQLPPSPKVVAPRPLRISPEGNQGVVAPGKPKALPKVVTPVPDPNAPSRVASPRPDPLGTMGTSGTLSYKYVCQARREWCYVNASNPIPAETMCFCGDLEGKTVAMK